MRARNTCPKHTTHHAQRASERCPRWEMTMQNYQTLKYYSIQLSSDSASLIILCNRSPRSFVTFNAFFTLLVKSPQSTFEVCLVSCNFSPWGSKMSFRSLTTSSAFSKTFGAISPARSGARAAPMVVFSLVAFDLGEGLWKYNTCDEIWFAALQNNLLQHTSCCDTQDRRMLSKMQQRYVK